MDYNFNFSATDCVRARKAVVEFCNKTIPASCGGILNVVDDIEPWKDVVSDFQTIMYIQLICVGMEHARRSKDELPMRHKSQQFYTQMLRCFEKVRRNIPFNDTTFVNLYADVDDIIYDRLDALATQVYYTICNSMFKETPDASSDQVHALSRLTVGYIFATMGISYGLQKAHHLDIRRIEQLPNSIMRLTSAIIHEQQKSVRLDEALLETAVDNAVMVVTNSANPMLDAVAAYAQKLDLTEYVKSADMVLTEVRKIKKEQQKFQKKRITTIKKAKK